MSNAPTRDDVHTQVCGLVIASETIRDALALLAARDTGDERGERMIRILLERAQSDVSEAASVLDRHWLALAEPAEARA